MTEWIKKTRPIYILPTRLSLEIEFSCEPKSILKKKKSLLEQQQRKQQQQTVMNGCVYFKFLWCNQF